MSWILDEEVLAVLTAIIIVTAVVGGVQVLNAGRVVEPFSELGLLGPSGKIGGYPREVVAGIPFQLNVYVGNHEGKTMYYRVMVKVGGKSSIINASMPLQSKPVMDIRVILSHNSSTIIPVNVTLYDPAINVRLVFEMWIYNETAGAFNYYGRWNQLWMNVTRPPTPTTTQKQLVELSPELESKIIEAYLSIRRAENSGGDVTEMVNLTNKAIEYAYMGDNVKAEALLNNTLALESEVSKAGIEANRIKLYMTIGSLATVAGICLTIYLYLRSNMWLLWAKTHKGWIIMKTGGGKNIHDGDVNVKNVKSIDGLTVNEYIARQKSSRREANKSARELYRMMKSGIVKIVDPKPPKTFKNFLISRYNLGFITSLSILMVGIICVYATESLNSIQQTIKTMSATQTLISSSITILKRMRYIFGSIIVLFLPGYSLVEALYPGEEDLTPLERLALSIGLSLAIVPLIGLVLNYTPWGIRLDPVLTAIATTTIMLLTISAYRKYMMLKLKTYANQAKRR